MSSQDDKKKRPPPIKIPPAAPHRLAPGPNAFAIAAKAKQEESEQQAKRPGNLTPVTSPLDGSHCAPPASQSRKDGSGLASAMTTFTQMLEGARGSSPRKSEGRSSTTSRHNSTTKSRHSNRSQRSAASGHAVNAGDEVDKPARHSDRSQQSAGATAAASSQHLKLIDEESDKTPRAYIEDRAEKKLYKLLGKSPENPDNPVEPAVRYSNGSRITETSDNKAEAVKSPKKKLFGVSLPSFGRSLNTPPVAPPMPKKAAQLLGTATTPRPTSSPAAKQNVPPRPPRPLRPAREVPRSDTSKSLPSKLYDGHSSRHHQKHYGSTQARHRTPKQKTNATEKAPRSTGERGGGALGGSRSDAGVPPTPPEKDTPPDGKAVKQRVGADVDLFGPVDSTAVPSDGGQSPTKFCPAPAGDYIKLVEQQRIASARAHVEAPAHVAEAVELEGDSRFPQLIDLIDDDADLQEKYPGWWNEEREKRFTNANGDLPPLPPTFYSPSTFSLSLFDGGHPSQNIDPERLLFGIRPHPKTTPTRSHARPDSIDSYDLNATSSTDNMVSQAGQQSAQSDPSSQKKHEPGFATRIMEELRRSGDSDKADAVTDGGPGGPPPAQLEPSTSNLTDMLSGISPSKFGYGHDSYGDFPSAVPPGLYGQQTAPGQQIAPGQQSAPSQQIVPGQQITPGQQTASSSMPPTPTWDGNLSDGSNILTHFYMCNTHIDVLGRTLYDIIIDGRREVRDAAKESIDKTNDVVTMLEQRFEEIKGDLSTLNRTTERASEHNQAVNAKLDKLMECIKGEVVDQLAKQTKKTADMENTVKALQKTVQELQKSVDTKGNAIPMNPNPFSSPPPHHRSQPSLTGFLDATTDAGRDNHLRVMPSIQEMRPEGRYRQHNFNGGNPQQFYRPSTAGPHTKEENMPFPGSNHYGHGNSGQLGGSYMGNSYGAYYPTGPNEHTFSYHQGPSK